MRGRQKNRKLDILKPDQCVGCGACEAACPQHLSISKYSGLYRKAGMDALKRRPGAVVFGNQAMKKDLVSDFDLIIGERIVSGKYGPGTITDVEYEKQTASGRNGKFSVLFDSGEEKHFKFPDAFEIRSIKYDSELR